MTPRFEPTVNLGQVITIATFAVTLGGLIWQQATFQTRTEEKLISLSKQVDDVQRPAINVLQSTFTQSMMDISNRLVAIETQLNKRNDLP